MLPIWGVGEKRVVLKVRLFVCVRVCTYVRVVKWPTQTRGLGR